MRLLRFFFLAQGMVSLALYHRSRGTYALTHLVPTKRYQRFEFHYCNYCHDARVACNS